jgi:antitoxin component of RelBE/YafQ-DinJ toxin-antitoxin module
MFIDDDIRQSGTLNDAFGAAVFGFAKTVWEKYGIDFSDAIRLFVNF